MKYCVHLSSTNNRNMGKKKYSTEIIRKVCLKHSYHTVYAALSGKRTSYQSKVIVTKYNKLAEKMNVPKVLIENDGN